jgi:hypothetical protein
VYPSSSTSFSSSFSTRSPLPSSRFVARNFYIAGRSVIAISCGYRQFFKFFY